MLAKISFASLFSDFLTALKIHKSPFAVNIRNWASYVTHLRVIYVSWVPIVELGLIQQCKFHMCKTRERDAVRMLTKLGDRKGESVHQTLTLVSNVGRQVEANKMHQMENWCQTGSVNLNAPLVTLDSVELILTNDDYTTSMWELNWVVGDHRNALRDEFSQWASIKQSSCTLTQYIIIIVVEIRKYPECIVILSAFSSLFNLTSELWLFILFCKRVFCKMVSDSQYVSIVAKKSVSGLDMFCWMS